MERRAHDPVGERRFGVWLGAIGALIGVASLFVAGWIAILLSSGTPAVATVVRVGRGVCSAAVPRVHVGARGEAWPNEVATEVVSDAGTCCLGGRLGEPGETVRVRHDASDPAVCCVDDASEAVAPFAFVALGVGLAALGRFMVRRADAAS